MRRPTAGLLVLALLLGTGPWPGSGPPCSNSGPSWRRSRPGSDLRPRLARSRQAAAPAHQFAPRTHPKFKRSRITPVISGAAATLRSCRSSLERLSRSPQSQPIHSTVPSSTCSSPATRPIKRWFAIGAVQLVPGRPKGHRMRPSTSASPFETTHLRTNCPSANAPKRIRVTTYGFSISRLDSGSGKRSGRFTHVARHRAHHQPWRWRTSGLGRYVVDAVVLEYRHPTPLLRRFKEGGAMRRVFPGCARCAPDRRELFRSRGCVSPGPHAPAAAAGLRWSQRHSRWTMSS